MFVISYLYLFLLTMLITLNILARRATSQKRPLDDFDQPEASGSSSNAYSSFAAAYAMNDQKPVIVENQQPTYLGNNRSAPISLINDSPVFGPALPPSQQQQQQQQMDTTSLNYGFGHSDSSMNWTASSVYSLRQAGHRRLRFSLI